MWPDRRRNQKKHHSLPIIKKKKKKGDLCPSPWAKLGILFWLTDH